MHNGANETKAFAAVHHCNEKFDTNNNQKTLNA